MKQVMNKLFLKLSIISIAILSGVLLFGLNVSAGVPVSSLVIQFQTTPLFNEASFLPGDSVTRSVIVTNNTVDIQTIGTQAVNINNSDHLGDVMNLVITQGANMLYSGTLSQFFSTGKISLSDLAGNGASTTYYYSITFDPNSGDDYQGKVLGFDVSVGVFGEGLQNTVVSNENNGGGSGGSIGENGTENPSPLLISEQTGNSSETGNTQQTGEVLGTAIIRTVLPETGGVVGKISRTFGVSTTSLFDYEINLFFGGIFILIMIVLLVIRLVIGKKQ